MAQAFLALAAAAQAMVLLPPAMALRAPAPDSTVVGPAAFARADFAPADFAPADLERPPLRQE
jgi:hypothetical protein